MSDLITVCTPTIGDTAWRLEIFFRQLKKFTRRWYRHVVSDDGTYCQHAVNNQRRVCEENSVEYTQNPGPFGVSYNLNHLFDQVETPWALLIEDGLLPSFGWLETALEAVEKIGDQTFQGHEVGMIGMASLQDWILKMGEVIPSGNAVMPWWRQECTKDFYATDWNDGYIHWARLLPGISRQVHGEDSLTWEGEPLVLKQITLEGFSRMLINPATNVPFDPSDQEQAYLKWRTHNHWPQKRTAFCGWYPGAFMLVNIDKWRKVGRWRDGCTFFEAHLGVRMGLSGFLSLCLENPPWLHCPSQGFRESTGQKTPRYHRDTDEVFKEDFKGRNHLRAVDLANEVVPLSLQEKINADLDMIQLSLPFGWRQWL